MADAPKTPLSVVMEQPGLFALLAVLLYLIYYLGEKTRDAKLAKEQAEARRAE